MTNPKTARVYTVLPIFFATFVGSILGGGILLAMNAKALKLKKQFRALIAFTAIVEISYLLVLTLVPAELQLKVPYSFYSVWQIVLILAVYASFQKSKIVQALQNNTVLKQPFWKTFVIAVVSFVVVASIIVVAFFLNYPPDFRGDVFYYGKSEHKIYYHNISKDEALKVADVLAQYEFLAPEVESKYLQIKTEEAKVVVVIPVEAYALKDFTVLAAFKNMQSYLKDHLKQDVSLVLFYEGLSSVEKKSIP